MKRFASAVLCLTIAVFACLLTYSAGFAQSQTGKVYTVAEQQPEFPGGTVALSRYLASTIRVPGVLIRKNYNTGPVAAKFIIDELGYVHDVRVVTRPINKKMRRGMEDFMANIIAAVEKMPRWEPGEVGGKRVPVFYTLPIEVNMQ